MESGLRSVGRPLGLAPGPALALALWTALLSCSHSSSSGFADSPGTPSGDRAFDRFVDVYFSARFRWDPIWASASGIHDYDTRLNDLSEPAVARRVDELRRMLAELEELSPTLSRQETRIDAELLAAQMKAELQNLSGLETWKKNPMDYVYLAGAGVDVLMKRDFAAPVERLAAMTTRLEQVPALLRSMSANVERPPRELASLAQRMAEGAASFLREQVLPWARDAARDQPETLARFSRAHEAAVKSLEEAARWLEAKQKAGAHDPFAIGSEQFRLKLLYEEMIDTPLEELLRQGEARLEEDHRAFVALARSISPEKSPREVMAQVSRNHPSATEVIPAARRIVEDTLAFIRKHDLMTIPEAGELVVAETPPYARDGVFASMDTPGPYETRATEAFYYVTPPELDWSPDRVEEHLRAYNIPVLTTTTIHEAYPGHYAQFLYARTLPSKTRRLLYTNSNVEGWAHYTEQMMLEEGFLADDQEIKLGQLQDALLRDCRYVAGIKMHVHGMSVEEAAELFVEQGFQEPGNALEEARRGAYDPTYLYYTWGKMEIYRLREDYQRATGSAYSLKSFHDAFLAQGGIPLKLIRQAMLPNEPQQ